MEYLADLGVFGGKVFVLVLGIGLLLIILFTLIAKARKAPPHLSVEDLNRKFEDMAQALKSHVWDEKSFKKEQKALKKKHKEEMGKDRKRIFVLDFHGDIRASHVDNLTEEITTLLTTARPGTDEIVVRIESPGGLVYSYGLAAAQLLRIRQAGIELTVCVDKVAASGGYMMACTAHRIVAAPFAILGSIGVVSQVPNFHRLLKKHEIDFEELTAGEFKRTVTLFGEITEKGRRKALEQIEDIHGLFKAFVLAYRPQLEIAKVATGEYWFGQRALNLNLVDELATSEEYLFRRREEADIFKIELSIKKKWTEKLAENIARTGIEAVERWAQQSRFLL